jgi:hypothetical protein
VGSSSRATIVALRASVGANRGRRVSVRFRTLRDARATRGERVLVEVQSAGRRRALGARRSGADGLVQIAVDLAGAGRIVARVAGGSASIAVAAARPLTLLVTPHRPRRGATLVAAGRLLAGHAAMVVLEAYGRSGWVTVVRERAGADGRYRLAAVVPRAGRYLLRTRVAGTRPASVVVAVQTR